MKDYIVGDATKDTSHWEGCLQILALDGGGLRGLFSAALLAQIEEKHGVNITDHFDLITGTSTGGLIALGLGLGMRPLDLVDFYVTEGPRIFGNLFGWRGLLQWVWRKYPQHRLKAALTHPRAFGDRKLGDSHKRLIIPAYSLGQDSVRIFKTPHHRRLKTDWKIPAWQVALATTAAPTYFPACCTIDHGRLIDGGVWANNPAVIGIAEGVSLLGARLDQIRVFSMGTTQDRRNRRCSLNRGGIFQWVVRKDVVDVLMRGQSVGGNGIAEHLVGSENLFRIDPVVPVGVYSLDRIRMDDLLAEAEGSALHCGPKLEEMFLRHRAGQYDPLFS